MAIQASPMHPAGVRKQLCSVVQRLSSMVMLALGAAVVVVDVVGIVVACIFRNKNLGSTAKNMKHIMDIKKRTAVLPDVSSMVADWMLFHNVLNS